MKTRFAAAMAIVVIALVTGGACKKKTAVDPTPTPTPAPKFTATLLPSNEVPAIVNADKDATGTMTITFNLTKDAAGTITLATADFSGTVTGFPPGTTLTAAHIHPGAAGVNGSPAVNLALTAGEITYATGAGTLVKSNISMTNDQANQILANPAGFYFNIHTSLNTGGAMRGQLVRSN